MNENLQKLIGMLIFNDVGFNFMLNEEDTYDYIYREVEQPYKGYILWEINIDEKTGNLILYIDDSRKCFHDISNLAEIIEMIAFLEMNYNVLYNT